MKKWLGEGVALIIGATFFWVILSSAGVRAIAEMVSRAGAGVLLVSLLYPLMSLWDVAAWRLLFLPEHSAKVHFRTLFWIRLCGEALNNVTPFVDIGGEPLKAHLLKKQFHLPMSSAAASTLVAKTSGYISQAFFMFFGAVFSFVFIPLSRGYRIEISILLFLICAVFSLFLILQYRGVFQKMNPEIRAFYRDHGGRFWRAVGLNAMGWIGGGIETAFFCHLAGVNISFLEGILLEALLQVIRTGGFFIPMSLGVQEGGTAFFIGLWGYDPVLGIGISLFKRFRQLLWTGIGFLVWGVFRWSDKRVA